MNEGANSHDKIENFFLRLEIYRIRIANVFY